MYQSALSIADALANGSTHRSARILTNRRIVLRSQPVGALRAEHFALEEHAVPASSADQVLLRTLYLSLDPYLHAGIEDAANDAVPVRVGQVMAGSWKAEDSAGWLFALRIALGFQFLGQLSDRFAAGIFSRLDLVHRERAFGSHLTISFLTHWNHAPGVGVGALAVLV